MAETVIVLMTHMPSTVQQNTDQTRATTLLKQKGTEYETIFGDEPAMKDRRNELFSISGIRGNYPQFFKKDAEGKIIFVGNWETVENINECDQWEETFGKKSE